MNYRLKSPLDIQLELTTDCNHHCYYCYNFWKYETRVRGELLNADELSLIFEKLRKNRIISLTVTGGEPFLYPRSISKCLELAKEAGIRADINSNLDFPDKRIDSIVKFGKVSILTSLLSHKQEIHDTMVGSEGSFKRTVENIKYCLKKGLKISINMVLTKDNFSDIYNTAKFAKELGATTFSATRAVPPIGSDNFGEYCLSTGQIKTSVNILLAAEIDLGIKTEILNCYPKCMMFESEGYYKFMHRICIAGQTALTIGANGDIRPCSHSNLVYGNILEEDLEKIWPRLIDWQNRSLLPHVCKKECKLQDICAGGCRIMAQYYGDIRGADPNMEIINLNKYPPERRQCLIPFDEIEPEKQFFFNNSSVFREEDFGGIIYVSKTRNMVAVNKNAYLFLHDCFLKNCSLSMEKFLNSSKAITDKEVINVKRLFSKLVHKTILTSII